MGYPKIGKARTEAFSDGVLAIILTIMVLELKAPPGGSFETLKELWPAFLSYVLSFVYIGIYWNNHHHMFHTCKAVTGSILWANLHLLFWLSLVPFATAWMGENHFTVLPTQVYGFVLFMAGLAYYILQKTIIAYQGPESILKAAIGKDWKGKSSPLIYLIAVIVASSYPWVAMLLYTSVALMWIVPDPRIAKMYHV
jgi:uncharacterized membrane protein